MMLGSVGITWVSDLNPVLDFFVLLFALFLGAIKVYDKVVEIKKRKKK